MVSTINNTSPKTLKTSNKSTKSSDSHGAVATLRASKKEREEVPAPSTSWESNVSRYSPLAPLDGSDPPRGCLVFDAHFECGNLAAVEAVDDCEYRLTIRGDTNNAKHTVWFYFSVENSRKDQRVVFHLDNFGKRGSLFETGSAAPVVRSSSQPRWRRIPERQVSCTLVGRRPLVTFTHLFDSSKSVSEFALCFPYTYTRLQRHLVVAARSPMLRRSLLASSIVSALPPLHGVRVARPTMRPLDDHVAERATAEREARDRGDGPGALGRDPLVVHCPTARRLSPPTTRARRLRAARDVRLLRRADAQPGRGVHARA